MKTKKSYGYYLNFFPLSASRMHSLCKKLLFNFVAVTLLFFIPFGLINAQSGKETLKKIQNKFKSITDFSADFSQTIFLPNSKQGGSLSGKFYYKRKNKFIVELKNSTIISDGETVWNYDSRQKRVVISSFSDDPTSFSLERYIFDYPALCIVNLVSNEKGKDEIIELVPKDNNIDFQSAKIWKNSDDMISKMEVVDLADTKYTFQLSSIKINQDIPDSKFDFTPPKGIKIIDLR